MASVKKTNVLLWVSLAASAAGIAAVVAVVKWQQNHTDDAAIASRLRDVQDVLSDCYDKIHEIEQHLPTALTERPLRSNGVTKQSGSSL